LRFIYYIDGEKFTTEDKFSNSLWKKISSPDDNTPAFETSNGYKFYCHLDEQIYRLNGPAEITSDGREDFYLNGKRYETIKEWINDHPNPDLYFDAIGLNETERVLWFLKK
jgi:hypothetical protein